MVATWMDRVWYDETATSRVARAVLSPLGAAYGAAMRMRNRWYDAPRHVEQPVLPAVSVGNLSVGGTGKTPMAAWCAQQLLARGARPAIVLRGYGDDEPAVHRLLTPDAPVVANADRLAGARAARAAGADVMVLDDAFQHRRVARVADVVLVSADRWRPAMGVVPAGPWREPIEGLARARVVVVTRKAASPGDAARVRSWVHQVAPMAEGATVWLSADRLEPMPRAGDATATTPRALSSVSGEDLLVVAGIGDPTAFAAQLTAAGARVTLRAFADHFAYDAATCEALARAAGGRTVVTTLKDAVKLQSHWPREGPPVWYVSQRVVVEDGGAALEGALAAVLAARASSS
jgi:tetraacyldisaccharide 4'-kinase